MDAPPLDELSARLGIVLREPELIRQAFVHSSFFNENPERVSGHNERLEFYGDAVIGVAVSRLLFERYPDEDEGFLTARRAALVNREALAQMALELGLDRLLRLGRGETDAGGATRPSLLAASFEALAGALSLSEGTERAEAGPREACSRRASRRCPRPIGPPKSAKSRLQEWSQRHRGMKPIYQLVATIGPAPRAALPGHRDDRRPRARLRRADRAASGPRSRRPLKRWQRSSANAGADHAADGVVSRLKELRLHGFKSFADQTRFVFEPGVNAVIGPNGSGKSNMADAVRWVLGEQSNRSLRTRRADDVIFGGSEQRRPQGMAEAVLTLDNADGWLPIDFAEVSIGRRAYRSGESEYLINGARARLRDVVELLGEGRLGANELVVVGQGTVDAALSLRPEERRQLFEEAAGVKGLQVRRNEASVRLVRSRDNLTRVGDLMGELKPQVRRLAMQAEHQQQHDTLGATGARAGRDVAPAPGAGRASGARRRSPSRGGGGRRAGRAPRGAGRRPRGDRGGGGELLGGGGGVARRRDRSTGGARGAHPERGSARADRGSRGRARRGAGARRAGARRDHGAARGLRRRHRRRGGGPGARGGSRRRALLAGVRHRARRGRRRTARGGAGACPSCVPARAIAIAARARAHEEAERQRTRREQAEREACRGHRRARGAARRRGGGRGRAGAGVGRRGRGARRAGRAWPRARRGTGGGRHDAPARRRDRRATPGDSRRAGRPGRAARRGSPPRPSAVDGRLAIAARRGRGARGLVAGDRGRRRR